MTSIKKVSTDKPKAILGKMTRGAVRDGYGQDGNDYALHAARREITSKFYYQDSRKASPFPVQILPEGSERSRPRPQAAGTEQNRAMYC